MTGLYWGRFNPPHKGHLALIQTLLKKVDVLIIAIGSAEQQDTKRNPFNGEERVQMLEAYCTELGIDANKIKIVPVPDGKSFSSSIKNVLELCSPFDILYTDKDTIINLLKGKVTVERIHRTGDISSTQIRDSIAHDKEWKHLTSKSVAQLIEQLNGAPRIKKAYLGVDDA